MDTKHIFVLYLILCLTQLYFNYSHARHKDVSVNDVLHIRMVVP